MKPEKTYTMKDFYIWLSLFVIIDLILVCIWLFTERTNSDFMMHFSFASTISSIILSVLAIILSIHGESRTQVLLDRIENEADKISAATERVLNLSSAVNDIKKTTSEMYSATINKDLNNQSNDNLDDSTKEE